MSADDTIPELDGGPDHLRGRYADETAAGDAQMIDPAHFEDDDDDADAPPPPAKDNKYTPSPEYTADDSTTSWAQNTGEGGSK